MRFAAEAWPWARLDEPRRASGSCSCQYVLLPRPVLGQAMSLDEPRSASGSCSCQYVLPPKPGLHQASMSFQAARACARANMFCLRGLSSGKFRRASESLGCVRVLKRFTPRPGLGHASMSLDAPRVLARANTFCFRGQFLAIPSNLPG